MAQNVVHDNLGRQLSQEDSENLRNEQAANAMVHVDMKAFEKLLHSTDSVYKYSGKAKTGRWNDCIRTVFVSMLTALLVSGGMYALIVFKTEIFQSQPVEVEPQAAHSKMIPQPEFPSVDRWTNASDSRRYEPFSMVFKIDPDVYRETHEIQWTLSSSRSRRENPASTSTVENSCVLIPHSGLYFLFLRITYVYNRTTDSNLYMYVALRQEGQTGEEMLNKNTITLPSSDLRGGHGFQPSYIADTQRLKAGDKLCVTVSPKDAIYVSPQDATFMLLRFG